MAPPGGPDPGQPFAMTGVILADSVGSAGAPLFRCQAESRARKEVYLRLGVAYPGAGAHAFRAGYEGGGLVPMKKRMILVLAGIVRSSSRRSATVKYGQIKKAMAQNAAFQPPPEAVTTIVAKNEDVAGDAGGDRHGRRGPRRHRQRRPARASSTKIAFESGQAVRGGRRARPARHAAGAGAARRGRGAARARQRQPRAADGPPAARGSRRRRSATAPTRSRSRPRRASARSARRSSARRSARRSPGSSASARSTSASTCAGGSADRARSSRSTRSTSTSPCRSRRSAA